MLGSTIKAIWWMYVGAGLFGGLLMSQAIPAMNAIGVAVYALIWPRFIYCAPVTRECEALSAFPDWAQALMFSF